MHNEKIWIEYLSLFIWGKLSENNQGVIYYRKLKSFYNFPLYPPTPYHFLQWDGEGIKLLGTSLMFNGNLFLVTDELYYIIIILLWIKARKKRQVSNNHHHFLMHLAQSSLLMNFDVHSYFCFHSKIMKYIFFSFILLMVLFRLWGDDFFFNHKSIYSGRNI